MGQIAEELLITGCQCVGPDNMSPSVDVFLPGLRLYTCLPRTDDRCIRLGSEPGPGAVRRWVRDDSGQWTTVQDPQPCDRDARVFVFENIDNDLDHDVHTHGGTVSGEPHLKFGRTNNKGLNAIGHGPGDYHETYPDMSEWC